MHNTLALNIAQLRAETPGCQDVLHFNNAGAALMPAVVSESVIEHIQLESRMGGYEAAQAAAANIQNTYQTIACLLNVQPHEVALAQSATRAWQQVFYAIPFRPGDRILTAMAEYASNYIAFLQIQEKFQVEIEVIPNDASGQLDVQALRQKLDERVKLVAITHVPTNGGLINPARAIGEIVKDSNALFLLDACQSAGQMPLDVQTLHCDFLTATSRKYLRGPRGAGFLYVREALIEQLVPPMLDLHAATWTAPQHYQIRPDARRFESWECSYATTIGLGVAVAYALNLGLDSIWDRIQALSALLRQRLAAMPAVTLQDLGPHHCGIVSFTVENIDPQRIAAALFAQQINISVSFPQSTLLDMQARQLQAGVCRASVHYYNTEDEIETFCAALQRQILPLHA